MEKLCYICGVAGFKELLATCMKCESTFIHPYCMKKVECIVPDDWACEDCDGSDEAPIVDEATVLVQRSLFSKGKEHLASLEKSCNGAEMPKKGVDDLTIMNSLATLRPRGEKMSKGTLAGQKRRKERHVHVDLEPQVEEQHEDVLFDHEELDYEDGPVSAQPAGPAAQEADDLPPGTLLVSYMHHRAYRVWRDGTVDLPLLKIHHRASHLSNFDPYVYEGPGTWWQELIPTGIPQLRALHWEGVDAQLVTAFLEHWHPETSSFHFPWGEMTITLHDVACLLGLRIDGDACLSSLADVELIPTIVEYYNVAPQALRAYKRARGYPVELLTDQWIERHGPLVDDDLGVFVGGGQPGDDPDRERFMALGYLSIALAATLFVDKSQSRVGWRIFGLVWDIPRAVGIAWGAGALAYLYRGLGEATRAEAKGLDGCTTLLQACIWAYFPRFRGDLSSDPIRIADRRWYAKFSPPKTPTRKDDEGKLERVKIMRDEVDRLTIDDVRWMPFGRDLDFEGEYRSSTYRGTITFCGEEEPYMPDRCLRQFGHVQGVPQPVIPPRQFTRDGSLKRRYVATFAAHHNRWHSQDDDRFYQLGEHRRTSEDCQVGVTADYMAWYASQSRQYVLSTTPRHPDPPAPVHPITMDPWVDLPQLAVIPPNRAKRIHEIHGLLRSLALSPRFDELCDEVMDLLGDAVRSTRSP